MRARLALLAALLPGILFGQEFRATLQGRVADQTGAVIPAAQLVLRNVETNVDRRSTTNASGNYVFQFLPPGLYRLTTSSQGFKTNVRDGIDLSLGQNQRLDIDLELGSVADTIEVVGNVSLVQTEDATTGAVVRSEIKESLPLKGRSSLFMFTLAPGVVNNRYGEDTRPNDTITNVLFSANGAPVAATDVAVDGAINTVNVNRDVNISQWVPAVDSVAEFKLQTGILPAQYGRSAGSMMNIVIKSGTNSFHGSFYELFRNSALDANTFFGRGRGQELAAFGANTFGATIGGPVLRDRTFFFASYEGAREGNAVNRTDNVPTALMRQGNFSEVRNAIYDPFSVSTRDGVPVREPFPGNVIPASRQDPVGRNVVNFFPEPNTPSSSSTQPWLRNFTFSDKWPRDYDMVTGKVDHRFSDMWHLFGRFNRGKSLLVFPHQFDGVASPGRNVVNRPHFGVSLGNTVLFTPRTTLDVRLGFSWGTEKRRPWSDGFDITSLGFSRGFQNIVQSQAFPTMSFAGFQNLAGSDFRDNPGYTWFTQPSVSLHRGRHLVKIGGEARLIYGNFFINSRPSGNFSFTNAWTDGPRADTPSPNTGFPIASLLAGLGSGTIDFETGVSIINKYYAAYVQDDYRISSRLTLNLGLRYEYETPRTERFDRTTRGFCYDCPSPLRVPGLNLTGGLRYAGAGGEPRGLYEPDRNNFSPRIGLAWRLTDRLVIRTGYGLYYLPIVGSVEPTGFDSRTQWVVSQDGITPKDRLANPFPDGHVPAIGNSQGLATLAGQNIAFIEPSDRTPMFHTWNFNIQRALPSNTVVEAGYVGSRGVKITVDPQETGFSENVNQLDPRFLSMGAALQQRVPNPFFGVIPTGALAGPTVQRQQLLRPYPQFLNVTRSKPAFGNSIYHAFQFRFQKRMAKGLTALVSYTASKLINDVSPPQNNYNRQAERAVAEFDAPQRLTITAAYDLPIGRGRPWLTDVSRAADLLAGGWTVSTFNTFQSGLPLTFRTGRSNIFALGTGAQRPDAVGIDPSLPGSHGSRLDRFFNAAAFAQPADFTFGNLAARTHTVRRPGMNNINLALRKTFQITERWKVEFRAASYNLLNHPVFNGPNTTFGTAAFGQITSTANLPRQTEFYLRIVF